MNTMELYGTLYESFGIVTEILSKLVTILSGTLFFSSLSTKGCCILIKTHNTVRLSVSLDDIRYQPEDTTPYQQISSLLNTAISCLFTTINLSTVYFDPSICTCDAIYFYLTLSWPRPWPSQQLNKNLH